MEINIVVMSFLIIYDMSLFVCRVIKKGEKKKKKKSIDQGVLNKTIILTEDQV